MEARTIRQVRRKTSVPRSQIRKAVEKVYKAKVKKKVLKKKLRKKIVEKTKFKSDIDEMASIIMEKHGSESVIKMAGASKNVPALCSTGIPTLDAIIGIGGYPKERLIEIKGPESGGKTTLTLHAIAACQAVGGSCMFVDVENALDLAYAKNLGVNTETLLLSQPDSGEQAMEIIDTSLQARRKMKSSKPLLIVLDSIAALTPQKELDGEISDTGAGLGAQARLMSQSLRRLVSVIKGTNTTIIFTNQLRMKIGVTWGSPETTPGGNAMKFYASIRIDIRNIGQEKSGDKAFGQKVRIKTIKNKVAPPFQEVICLLRFGKGIDLVWDVFEALKHKKLLITNKGWHRVKDVKEIKNFQGYKGFLEAYKENKKLIDNLLKEN